MICDRGTANIGRVSDYLGVIFFLSFLWRLAIVAIWLVVLLVPGRIMMNLLQNAFANTSPYLVISKAQSNIIDLLMLPLGPGELVFGLSTAGMTLGVRVGMVTVVTPVSPGGMACHF